MTRALLLLAAALCAAGCRTDCTPRDAAARPNVVLVTIDTLRADHLGAYGSTTVRTPNLDRLAQEGVVFEQAFSQTHVTVPSHLSIMSSLPIVEHGVLDNLAPVARPVDVLPAFFRTAGYHTGGFVSATHLGPRRAVGQLLAPHLETFEFPRRASKPFVASETNAKLFPWIEARCREPFFAWVHYWDPHMPYTPPAPWNTAYYDGDPFAASHTSLVGARHPWLHYELGGLRHWLAREATAVRKLKHDLALRTRDVRQLVLYPIAAHGKTPEATADARARLRAVGDALPPHVPFRAGHAHWQTGVRDARYPESQYAGEVAYTDAQVGALRDELERIGVADRTILVVTADHGELLGEHGVWFEHAGLHDPSVHVPFIVWAPGRVTPTRRADVVSGLDVAPTILGLVELPRGDGMRGRDLFAGLPADAPLVIESSRGNQLSVRAGGWKLIRTLHDVSYAPDFEREAGSVELYDLAADPGEQRNLAASEPQRRAALDGVLDAWIAAHPPAGTRPPAAQDRPTDRADDLRALGYVE
jgi:choline-sulfatase